MYMKIKFVILKFKVKKKGGSARDRVRQMKKKKKTLNKQMIARNAATFSVHFFNL